MAMLDSFTHFGASIAQTIRNRIALVGLDLEQAMWRIATTTALAVAMTLSLVCASVFGASAFVAQHWETDRVWALLTVGAVYAAVAICLGIGLFQWTRRRPFMMHDSIDTLRQDVQFLTGQQ